MNEVRDASQNFEAVKIAMTQDKNGHVLKLSIHPQDTPEDLLRDAVGQRYMVVLVRLNDQDEPVKSTSQQEGDTAVSMAAMLAQDEKFQAWLCINGLSDEATEEAAAVGIRSYCGVKSRSELKVNRHAREKFMGLREEFILSLRR